MVHKPQHQQPLGACWKGRLLGLAPENDSEPVSSDPRRLVSIKVPETLLSWPGNLQGPGQNKNVGPLVKKITVSRQQQQNSILFLLWLTSI